ncbi:AAA domain-containing protein [Gracilibacillus oryzae]|uniref:AAA domain-containing protein n=1 Tax=Gracilibacillus oryzae TaxID=1672701 RepID=A0A7C8L494_9BACI|nr:AAA family ATPase [Gracilibacillus oryzae]KAB8126059.1 AAA domain-containing protein [Gracilibacillus oryzae]
MFQQELQKVQKVLEETSDIHLSNEYDALLIKPLASSNLMRDNRTSSSKQSHIALSGKDSQDFFPYVDIFHYTDSSFKDQSMKSFYVLQVPVDLNENNVSYANLQEVEFNFDSTGTLSAKGSVKLSRPGSSPQIELGNTSTSDDVFCNFRRLFYEGDFLIILKEKKKVKYEAYIIKSEDGQRLQLNDTVEFEANRSQSTIVDLEEITPDNLGNMEEIIDTHEGIVGENVIYYGAPGTGKSFGITQNIKGSYPNFEDEESMESSFVFRTTLHPEYSYSDFVGQIMPKVEGDSIKYVFTPGVFTRALSRAIAFEDVNQPVFLVLEELSRANVATVFGDLFQLLDRKNGKSEYAISNSLIAKEVYNLSEFEADNDAGNKKIYLPKNLIIYGTVNTNDQNVFVMDTAFKRRFKWKYISTKPVTDQDGEELNNPVISIGNGVKVKWWEFYQKLNDYITGDMKLGEDKQVGQFFMQFTEDEIENNSQVQNKLLQYLWDDVEQASFTGKKLFNNVSNYSNLYEMFERNEDVFHVDFLSTLELDIQKVNGELKGTEGHSTEIEPLEDTGRNTDVSDE